MNIPSPAARVAGLTLGLWLAAQGGCSEKPSLRASIMIGRIMRQKSNPISFADPLFVDVCRDVLRPGRVGSAHESWEAIGDRIRSTIQSLS